jgi:hypothetical protein
MKPVDTITAWASLLCHWAVTFLSNPCQERPTYYKMSSSPVHSSGDVLGTGKGTSLGSCCVRTKWELGPFGASLVSPPSFRFLVFSAELACSSVTASLSVPIALFDPTFTASRCRHFLGAFCGSVCFRGERATTCCHRPASRQPGWHGGKEEMVLNWRADSRCE